MIAVRRRIYHKLRLYPSHNISQLTYSQVAITAAANSIQAFSTLTYTRQIYNTAPHLVTPLSGRTFGTWTFLSAIVRFYAAFNIHDPVVYKLAFATYVVAWAHFMGEWFVFGTAKWNRALAGPVFVSTGSLVWMLASWEGYVGRS